MHANNRATGIPLPVRRTELEPNFVLAGVDNLRTVLNRDGLELDVDHTNPDTDSAFDSTFNPTITVRENERHMSMKLSKLIARFERAGVEPTPAALNAALIGWVDNRPVTDVDAATKGIATLAWVHHEQSVRWRVVVPRRTGVSVDWIPTLRTPLETVRQTRATALSRSSQLTVTAVPTGEVTVWVYLFNPRLSTAVLTQPELLAAGQPIEDLYAVFSPERPVAVATRVPAMRMTEESNEPHVALPLADLNNIGWM